MKGIFTVGLLLGAASISAQNVSLGILDEVGIEQRLEAPLPLDVTFQDERDRQVTLGSIFGERPVLLVPVYYECPMLCQEVLRGLTRGLKGIPFDVGDEVAVVAVSFDTEETAAAAAAKRGEILALYGERGRPEGWHFLRGDPDTIEQLTTTLGFRFAYDDARDEFAHASMVVLATPDGRIARYYFGLDYAPRDLRLGIVEASQGKVGGLVEALLLYCYHYDPLTGRYGVVVINVLRVAGLLTVALLGGSILLSLRHERRRAGPVSKGTA